MHGCVALMSVCTVFVTGVLRGQTRILNPLQLELEIASQHVGVGFEPGSSGRIAGALNRCALSSVPRHSVLNYLISCQKPSSTIMEITMP